MKRLSVLLVILSLALTQHVHAQYYSVNYDARTVAAMAAAFGTEFVAESYYREQVDEILKHYTAAEVAAAGIFASKFLEHKALSDLGIWCSSTENYYYRRIYHMVAEKIMPKIWMVAKLMLRSPQTAIHWGSYLMKVCDETKSLCMQFESVVTNSTLSFSDIAFLEIDRDIAALLNLAELGGADWKRILDNLAQVPGRFTVENLKGDIDNLYNMGVGLATSGAENLGDALLQSSAFHDLLGGKVEEIYTLYEHYGSLFEQAEHDIGGLLVEMVGGQDNVAALFSFGNYDLTSWITDYMDEAVVHRTTRARERVAMRLLPAHGRQQHIERGGVDPLQYERSGLLPERLATGAGPRQLGTVCRMVKKPGATAQQQQRRIYLYHQLLATGLHHQQREQADEEGIRLRDTRNTELEPDGSGL